MKEFNNAEFEAYKDEVKEKWGNTEAYAEYSGKHKQTSGADFSKMIKGLDMIMAEFALSAKADLPAYEYAVQLIVENLKKYITDNFYKCTLEILEGLGKMYVADDRFRKNIDKHGEGTAEYVSRAIEIYCGNKGLVVPR